MGQGEVNCTWLLSGRRSAPSPGTTEATGCSREKDYRPGLTFTPPARVETPTPAGEGGGGSKGDLAPFGILEKLTPGAAHQRSAQLRPLILMNPRIPKIR